MQHVPDVWMVPPIASLAQLGVCAHPVDTGLHKTKNKLLHFYIWSHYDLSDHIGGEVSMPLEKQQTNDRTEGSV